MIRAAAEDFYIRRLYKRIEVRNCGYHKQRPPLWSSGQPFTVCMVQINPFGSFRGVALGVSTATLSTPAARSLASRHFPCALQDCYNRPIGSAPGAWIDVLERDYETDYA